MKARVLIVPGIGNSSPSHWHSLWQEADAVMFSRIELSPIAWNEPQRDTWVAAIADAMQRLGPDTILVAHSLGRLVVAHWAASMSGEAGGALLVSPPDPAGQAFPPQAASFAPASVQPLAFPGIVVASSNDPYLPLFQAHLCAVLWRSRFYEAGARGHMSASDGLGDCPVGKALVDELRRDA